MTDSLSWRDDANCLGVDPELFFPIGHALAGTRQICADCDVFEQCLKYALEHELRHGWYANTAPKDRQRIRKAG